MNGQSGDSLASLWSKFKLEGDFCIEMYAGIRHGHWYSRVGDLNITVMNKIDAPSSGYTFTCSGWDPDHSQKQSRMFRNGKLIANSDKYLTPRLREGNRRKFFNPLIKHGRDVHGAWYYIKARRIGNLVEYYFDNEKIFSYTDKNPIKKGGFGIWTFMNSMMVARVKVAAEKITIKPFYFTEINPKEITLPNHIINKTKEKQKLVLELNDMPANKMTQDYWEIFKNTENLRLTFPDDSTLILKNLLGAGLFAVAAKDLTYPEKNIAAWTCELKRTKNTKFNFHFELGTKTDGKYKTLKRYFYQISGTDYSKGIYKFLGKTAQIPSTKKAQLTSSKNWTKVFFTVPNITPYRGIKNLVWKVQGFGNYQTTDIVQGLQGNLPNAAFAVKNFSPVYLNVPYITYTPLQKAKLTYQLQLPDKTIKTDNLPQFNQKLKKLSSPKIISGKLSIQGRTPPIQLQWITDDKKNNKWICKWDKDNYYAIRLSTDEKYRYIHDTPLRVKIQNIEVPVKEIGINTFRVSLIENSNATLAKRLQKDTLNIELINGNKKQQFTLKWKNCPRKTPPILTKLDGITPFFQSFENTDMSRQLQFSSSKMKYKWDKDLNTRIVRISNKRAQRLVTPFTSKLSIANYPILAFMYKVDYMGQISLLLKNKKYIYLSEPRIASKKVNFATELQKDNKWHSWIGMLADAFNDKSPIVNVLNLNSISFGSFDRRDQTGLHSQLFLNDLAFGPAVNSAKDLTFTAEYFSHDKNLKVQTAIISGPSSYFQLKNKERSAISWKNIKNNVSYTPELKNINEGLHFLLIKAIDSRGNQSNVTSIPFLYDKTSDSAKFAFHKTVDSSYNGTLLQITINTKNGAPLNTKNLQIRFDGKKAHFSKRFAKFNRQAPYDRIEVNWPYMLKSYLQKMKDGETKKLLISDLIDGAGNKIKDITIPIKVDYKKDKQAPTVLKQSLPESIYHKLTIYCNHKQKLPLLMRYIDTKSITDKSDKFFRIDGTANYGYMYFINPKKPAKHPVPADSLIFMRMRFPEKEFPKNATITLNITFSNKKNILLNILNGKIKGCKTPANTPDINNKKWQNFIIDLKQLYRMKYKKEKNKDDLKNATIKGLILNIKHFNKITIFDLSNFEIFNKLKSSDNIKIHAYDKSGIQGIKWELTDTEGKKQQEGKIKGKKFKISTLIGNGKIQILKLQIQDRPGNTTIPMYFPILLDAPPPPPPPPAKKKAIETKENTKTIPKKKTKKTVTNVKKTVTEEKKTKSY